jgi:hypothetical protein
MNPGYWRANLSSDNLEQCFYNASCPGGTNLSCAEGY